MLFYEANNRLEISSKLLRKGRSLALFDLTESNAIIDTNDWFFTCLFSILLERLLTSVTYRLTRIPKVDLIYDRIERCDRLISQYDYNIQ